MLNRARTSFAVGNRRRFSTAIRQHIQDEGDWFYSSEWWSNGANDPTVQTVFREVSDKGNGVVSVFSSPSSKPEKMHWTKAENWLGQRYAEMYPTHKHNNHFRILGYQWRTLHFNDNTRQSTVKTMAGFCESHPASLFLMQQPHCLAVPYIKSMICAGLTTISSCGYDLKSAVLGKKRMNVLCIGHGGGSIPLFLASKIQVHIVEIDPVVISASVQAMGFPSFTKMTESGEHASLKPDPISEVLWKGIHERLLLYESDAEMFVPESRTLYDVVFIDAYDGEDIFPYKLRDPDSPFLRALSNNLHPEHGTVVVNLHSDSDVRVDSSVYHFLPKGKYISGVCRTYKDVLVGNRNFSSGLAYSVSVPWVCNTSLVVCRGFGKAESKDMNMVLSSLVSQSVEVETILDLNFSCLPYITRDFHLVT